MPDARPGPTSERSKRCEDCGRPIPSYRKKLCPEHALARLEERKRTPTGSGVTRLETLSW